MASRSSREWLAVLAVGLVAGCGEQALPVSEEWEIFEGQILGHEELIAQCMAEEGFEYAVAMPESAYYEKAAVEAELRGEEVDLDSVDPPEDPNIEIYASLDAPLQIAYDDVLWGTDTSVGCVDSTFEEAWGVSMEQIAGSGGGIDVDEFQALVEADARVQAARSAFSDCVEAEGFSGRSVEDLLTLRDEYLGPIPAEKRSSAEVVSWEERFGETYDRCAGPLGDVLTEVEAETIENMHSQ